MTTSTVDTARLALMAQVEAAKEQLLPQKSIHVRQHDGTLAGYIDQWGEGYYFEDTYHISRRGEVRELDDVRAVCLGEVDEFEVAYRHWVYKGAPLD